MEPTFDIPDSTDWLSTPLTLLAPLETSLRCQVCKDFFDNPVITSCSHTFCSLCIRRCLSTEGKCPTCRSSDQELKLRRNWAVQELVEGFMNARPSVLELARRATEKNEVAMEGGGEGDAEQPVMKKRKIEAEDVVVEKPEEGVRTRSQSRGVTRQAQVQADPIEIVDDIQDQEYIPDDGLVACPVCSRRMKNEAVFRHLDICTGAPAQTKPTAFGSLSTAPRNSFPDSTEKPPERLPHINYDILKEGVLRKKLKDLGIPNWGPKPLLQKRHTEWMNLWNANCDSRIPKPKRDLLRELDVWERTQGGNSTVSTDWTSTVMRKDFDTVGWSATYTPDFKQLVANARKKKDAAVLSTIPNTAPVLDDPQSALAVQEPILEDPIIDEPILEQPPQIPFTAQAKNGESAPELPDSFIQEPEVQAAPDSINT
ncbi:hypothetical protein BJY04DRAFT_226493 [Aspergillus karnatakaensis]|uniref:E3 ubiquitin-protein ligase RAD18 n=1 Tax=Aspergillus karnatakaensis TaxID=1810916 RepID=UPI003CCD0346